MMVGLSPLAYGRECLIVSTLIKARFAQAFRWAIKLAILLYIILYTFYAILFLISKCASLEQYCQQHCCIYKPALK
jgi:hypothetical protein